MHWIVWQMPQKLTLNRTENTLWHVSDFLLTSIENYLKNTNTKRVLDCSVHETTTTAFFVWNVIDLRHDENDTFAVSLIQQSFFCIRHHECWKWHSTTVLFVSFFFPSSCIKRLHRIFETSQIQSDIEKSDTRFRVRKITNVQIVTRFWHKNNLIKWHFDKTEVIVRVRNVKTCKLIIHIRSTFYFKTTKQWRVTQAIVCVRNIPTYKLFTRIRHKIIWENNTTTHADDRLISKRFDVLIVLFVFTPNKIIWQNRIVSDIRTIGFVFEMFLRAQRFQMFVVCSTEPKTCDAHARM